jgi:hypothetical protein
MIQLISDQGDHVYVNLGAKSYRDIQDGVVGQEINNHGAIDHRPWLFDSSYEGHGRRDIGAVVQDIQTNTSLDSKQCGFLIAADEDLDDLQIRYRSWPWYLVCCEDFFGSLCSLGLDWPNLTMHKCFISLARRPSHGRAQMTRMLLDRLGQDQGLLSFGSAGFVDDDLRGIMQPYVIPRLLDDIVSYDRQHRPPPMTFLGCLVNLVNETIDECDIDGRDSIFITEKTFKCFAWRQIPIWNARPGIVNSVRRLGFDVFDDVFDQHGYDSIADNHARRCQVTDILQQFCARYQGKLDDLRRDLWPRIQHNVDLLQHYISSHSQHRHKLTKYLLNKE